MAFSFLQHDLAVIASSDGELGLSGWILLIFVVLPLVFHLSRYLLWGLGMGLCSLLGSRALAAVSAIGLFVTILATPLLIPPYVSERPEPEQPESQESMSAYDVLGIPEPEEDDAGKDGERKRSMPVDPYGLVVREGRVWETTVGLIAWLPGCFIDGGNFMEPRWPFREPWSPLGGGAWLLIPPAAILCLFGVLKTVVLLPFSLLEVRRTSNERSLEPPLVERLPALGWVVAMLFPVVLNDLGIVEYPKIVVAYLTLVCFASLFAFRDYAFDKSKAVSGERDREEERQRRRERYLRAEKEGRYVDYDDDFEEEISGAANRVPESTLQFYGLIGGWPGALAAQGLLWHKVSERKEGFRRELAVRIFLHCLFVALFLWAIMGLYSSPGK